MWYIICQEDDVDQKASEAAQAPAQSLWEWCTDVPGLLPHWRSTSGRTVRIFPPLVEKQPWQVVVYGDGGVEVPSYEISGDDAERRAFCVGEVAAEHSL
jgi:hypothetical protein